MATKIKTFRLGSSPMVSAPGMVRWAIAGAKFPRDRKTVANVIAQTWSVPMAAAIKLVTQTVPFTVEGETVVFTA
ncbi:hypothetical protein HAP48_0042780 [Bradyrhizobium septentrionale]|uniref:hypothetical protein n=1 Tax=Bradyrhizobium septentrionale TaxID=1404411 RepID=UPI001AED2EA1|nr:hypothetical protein [Bradyrhizobium septentrionale]UGY15184.1 hypothetical protein HAP48_0042780 [Bradyrhizobium septentrionale]